jgi:hypothetical protein
MNAAKWQAESLHEVTLKPDLRNSINIEPFERTR